MTLNEGDEGERESVSPELKMGGGRCVCMILFYKFYRVFFFISDKFSKKTSSLFFIFLSSVCVFSSEILFFFVAHYLFFLPWFICMLPIYRGRGHAICVALYLQRVEGCSVVHKVVAESSSCTVQVSE